MHLDSIRGYSRRIAHLWDCFNRALLPLKCLNCGTLFHPAPCKSVTGDFLGKELRGGIFQTISPGMLFTHVMAEHLCQSCVQQFEPTEAPCCVHCGIRFTSREGRDHVCGECLKSENLFGKARSVGVYDQALMAVIHCFKYRHRVNLARPLSILLLQTYYRFWQEHPMDMVVPVPLYPHRFRERGFNQAYLVLRPWTDPDWQQILPQPLAVKTKILERIRPTAPQTGLGRKDRQSNVRHAFKVKNVDTVKEKRILVVDDVYTTGATVNECARILMQAGADRVDVLTIARAI